MTDKQQILLLIAIMTSVLMVMLFIGSIIWIGANINAQLGNLQQGLTLEGR